MKPLRFIITVGAVFLGLSLMYVGAFLFALRYPVWPYHWLREVYLIKDDMAARAPGPRCLIVGGSSAWFGLQSDLIERATGWHVINLGMHGDIPLNFQLWQAGRHLRRGDTVILAEELLQYWPRARNYTTFASTEIGLMAPDFWWQAPLRDKYALIKAVPPSRVAAGLTSWWLSSEPAHRQRLARPPPEELWRNLRAKWAGTYVAQKPTLYSYLELNAHGDMAHSRATAKHDHQGYGLDAPPLDSRETWRTLRAWADELEARGVRCLSIWPPFELHAGFDLNSPQVRANFDFYREHLKASGWPVVGEPEDGAMPGDFFFDSPFHYTTEGARRHTERLVERLRAAGLTTPNGKPGK